MKTYLIFKIPLFFVVLFFSCEISSQNVNLGILESFEGFTGSGAVTNGAGASWSGDVGTNNGSISGFGAPPFFVGNVYNANATTAQSRIDLFRLYIHLNDLFVDFPATHAGAFGGGETILPGVYSIPGAGSIGAILNLDGGGNPNAFFVIKFFGAMTVGANAQVNLIGGTKSSNVFFIADGTISVAANANLKGTILSRIGAIDLGAGAILEGRMFTLEGALVTGVGAKVSQPPDACTIPIFCENICNPNPAVDVLGVLSNYALYTNLGAVSNTGVTGIDGNIGSNSGSATGFENSIIAGSFNIANASTAQAKIDVENAYNSLMALPNTVPSDAGILPQVLFPHDSSFGSTAPGGETVNAGVYFINASGSLGGTLLLDGQNNPNAIFVFKFASSFTVAAGAKMILINGARQCNVFWIGGAGVPTGAIAIGAGAVLKGTFLSHNGACGSGASVFLGGRLLSTSGAVTSYSAVIFNNPVCITSKSLKTPAIEAVTDSRNVLSGTNTTSVLLNDTVNGAAAVIGTEAGQVKLTSTPNGPLTMNADGTITVASNTAAGTYSISYTICAVSNPLSCSTVTSTVNVTPAVISAGNDGYDIHCATASTLGNVLANDTLNTTPLAANDVIITLESATNTNIILNTYTGDLSITNSLGFGEYTLVYKICEKLNPTNCSSGTVIIKVTQPAKPAKVHCSDTYTFTNCAWVKDNKVPLIR